MELSDAAKALCGQYFPTPASKLRSGPPHETLGRIRPAMDELVAAGLVSEAPFNGHGVVEFTGSDRAAEIGRAHRQAVFTRSLFPDGIPDADGEAPAHPRR